MQTCPSYGVNTTKPTVQDQVYEECDTKAYEELYNQCSLICLNYLQQLFCYKISKHVNITDHCVVAQIVWLQYCVLNALVYTNLASILLLVILSYCDICSAVLNALYIFTKVARGPS